MLEILATIAMMTSTIDNVQYTVSSTAYPANTNGCIYYESKEIYLNPDAVNPQKTLYHELGHYYFQHHFYEDTTNTEKFWNKNPYYKKGTFAYEWYELENKPYESMAMWYSDYRLNKKVPKQIKKWFEEKEKYEKK